MAEKSRDYFVVRDTANTNVVFSYIISGLRKGYAATSLDLERKEDIEIAAVIDEAEQSTEIQIISQPSTTTETQLEANQAPETQNLSQTIPQSLNSAQSTQQTQENITSDTTSLAISVSNSTSNLSQPEPQQFQQNLSAGTSTTSTSQITGNTINELKKDIPDANAIELKESNFIVMSADEDEIIREIQQKTKLDKEKIKRAIKFKKKEPIKEEPEEELEEVIPAQIVQLGYVTKVNGSVVIRLG